MFRQLLQDGYVTEAHVLSKAERIDLSILQEQVKWKGKERERRKGRAKEGRGEREEIFCVIVKIVYNAQIDTR